MAFLAFLWQDHHYTLAKPSDGALNTLTVQICSVDCHTPRNGVIAPSET